MPDNIYEAFGYDPSCIAITLGACLRGENPYLNEVLTKFNTIKERLDVLDSKNSLPHNCADLLKMGKLTSGVYTIHPYGCCPDKAVKVYCDQKTDDGGWTVIQKRDALPKREDLFRTWIEYKLGFGHLTEEFWLGLDNIHALVNEQLMELRIDLEDFQGNTRWAKYKFFHVGNEDAKYVLHLGSYSGNAGDSLSRHNGMKFSTKEMDNDTFNNNCANLYKGAWWYKNCHDSNLNGFPYEGNHKSHADGINWKTWRGHNYSLKMTQMSVRPVFT